MSQHSANVVRPDRPEVRIDWRVATPAAAALALLFAAQNTAVLGFRQSYGEKLMSQGLTWGIWLLLVPVVFAVAARAHAMPAKDWRRWAFELGASVAITLLHGALVGVGHHVARPGRFGLGGTVGTFMSLSFPSDVLRYWFIASIYHALAYHREVRRRDVAQAVMAQRLAEAKLENLEARLQPHFLFNALNAISALIRKNPPAAATMVGQLSELLRAALSMEVGREVTLAGELRLLDQYVAIQRTRFPDRLSVIVHAPPETLDAYVPQLILQPLVENSVRHGIGSREVSGTVGVEASRLGDVLRLTVRDDGIGFGNAPASLHGSGIGLRSTRARLSHHYGDDFVFDIRATQPTGTLVTIDVPFRTQALRTGAAAS